MGFWIRCGPLLVVIRVSEAGAQEAIPLRIDEPAEDVVADLTRDIPRYMSERNTPGAAIGPHQGRRDGLGGGVRSVEGPHQRTCYL